MSVGLVIGHPPMGPPQNADPIYLTRAHVRSAATLREHPISVKQSWVVSRASPEPWRATCYDSPRPKRRSPEISLNHHLARCLSLAFILAVSLLGLPPVADAAEATGHYDRDKVMGQSGVFVGLNSKQVALVGPLESAMKRMDAALASLDLSVALTEGVIDRAQRDLWKARLDERAGSFSTFFDAFQERFDAEGAAYQTIFVDALERATAGLGGEIVECANGPSSPFDLAGPSGAASTCAGEDVSARIAEAWDRDSVLAAELEKLGAVSWPSLASYDSEEPALVRTGGGPGATTDGWVAPSDLASGIPEAAELFNAISRRAERARRELVAESQAVDREAEDAAAQLALIRDRAKQLRLKAESAKAALGAAIWEAFPRALKKDKSLRKMEVGICMNPSDWGSCSGVEMTAAVQDALLADRKLQKNLQRQLADLSD